MVERETVTRETEAVPVSSAGNLVANIIYIMFSILEALLAFRLVFKLLGANSSSGFVSFIYALTEPFVMPFYGIFGRVTTDGATTTAVFEPAVLIAMIVYALICWAIISIV